MQGSCTASVKCRYAVFKLVIVIYNKMIELFVHRTDCNLFFLHVFAKYMMFVSRSSQPFYDNIASFPWY